MAVIVVGSANIDSVVRVARHPLPGETLQGGELETHFGGKGANQAVAAARAGAVVRMVGRVGDDPMGAAYLERLAAFGVDTRQLLVTDGSRTGHAAIAVADSGENTIVISPGANARVSTDDLAPLDGLEPADVVVLQRELDDAATAEAMRRAAAAGCRVVLNLAPFGPLPAEVLVLADPLVVNESEAAELAEAGIEVPSLLVTRGADGSTWNGIEVAATHVDDVVDTTGAGDTYCGTLAARLAAGDAPEDAMRAASEAAAAAVRWAGAQPEPSA